MSRILVSVFLCLFLSCQKDDDTGLIKGELVSYEYVATLTRQQVLDYFPERSDYEESAEHIPEYDIKIYSYVYQSSYKGSPLDLSGLIMVPITTNTPAIAVYLHGTMRPYPVPEGEGVEDIPSFYKGEYPDAYWKQGETRWFGSYTASHGYIVVLPDYAGYNVSAHVPHPYTIHRELAFESVDAIFAARQFLQQENIPTNGKVFLSGWSEGAGASLAAQKLIEEKYPDDINLVAAANLAGPYDMKSGGQLMSLVPLSFWEWEPVELDGIIWSLYATNLFADNPLPWNRIFKIPFEDEIDLLKDRTVQVPSQIFQPSFTGNEFIKDEFEKNDLIIGWTPKNKLLLYYGTKDGSVFPFNSENAYNAFKNRGADVELFKYVGDDHYTPAMKYYLSMIEIFDGLN